jgi:hypothetical protein
MKILFEKAEDDAAPAGAGAASTRRRDRGLWPGWAADLPAIGDRRDDAEKYPIFDGDEMRLALPQLQHDASRQLGSKQHELAQRAVSGFGA